MRIVLRTLALLLLAGLSWTAGAVHAQSGKAVVVRQRDADIFLQSNGDAQFVETWVVEFQNGAFTFAFREIPKNRLREISDIHVSEGDEELRVETATSDASYKFTWYFPATNRGANFFSDVHTLRLRYTVRGAMRIYPEGDQFWWKFVEGERGYPIQSSQVLLHLPAAFSPDQVHATTYVNRDESGGARLDEPTGGSAVEVIEYNGGPFPPDTEWEIRAQFPHVVSAAPEAWQVSEDRLQRIAAQTNFYSVLAAIILAIGGPLFLLVLWFLLGRDKPTTFQAEFLSSPPDDTPPGVVGTLLDERADLQDILATVADLARRGWIRIREGDAFGTPEYERLKAEDAQLAPFEVKTLDALFRGLPVRRLADMRGSFYYELKELEQALYDQVVARGYFPASPLATREFYFKLARWGGLLVPTLGLVVYCATFSFAPLIFLPLMTLELVFVLLLGLSRVMPQRTASGARAAAQWNAFKRYLAQIEKYTQVDKAQDQFNRYLPYAIAFGLEKSWIDTFTRVDTPAPSWYVPYVTPERDWSWRELDSQPGTNSPRTADRDVSGAGRGAVAPSPPAPIFHDSPPERPERRLPDLNTLAANSFLGLNQVSGNMFDFLNSSAAAFTEKPATRSAGEDILMSIGSWLERVSAPGDGGASPSSSSSGESSWWSSSSSDSSSSSSWSDGGSSGGGGGGGGSSGFG